MLPFRKKLDDGVGVGPIESIERKPDEDSDHYDMLNAVAEDILSAIERKDKRALKDALESLCFHIQDLDAQQDEGMMGE